MQDAAAVVRDARRLLVVGIGGGGDVVGALAFAEAARALGTPSVVGGLTWERRVVDPVPGPRRLAEISGIRPLDDAVALAGPDTRGPGGFAFCEGRMAEFLDEPVVLVDPNPGPAAVGASLARVAGRLDCDMVVLLDVGGDVLAHGDEAGLASPLADAVLLAAAPVIEAAGVRTLGVVFGAGCDGELDPDEVVARLDEVGGVSDLPFPEEAIARAEAAVEVVLTEASAMALRCARGETGEVPIRDGRRTVRLTADGGRMACFDCAAALDSAARLAAAVGGAPSLEAAHEILTAMGIRTELAYERDAFAARDPGPGPGSRMAN